VLALGGIGFALTENPAPPPPPARPEAARPELPAAPAPRSAETARWVAVTGRVVFPEDRDIPKPRFVAGNAIKDAEFFLPVGTLDYGDVVIDAKTRGVANAVVWLRPDADDRKATFPADKLHPRFGAKPKDHLVEAGRAGFSPRVVAARAGDRVVFGNPTPVPFNVHYRRNGPSDPVPMGMEPGEFNVILPSGKTHATKALPALRICDTYSDMIHPWVQGYVWAFDHPYFAVTDSQGRFTIPDAPAGTWRLVVWHEKTGYLGGARGRTGERVTIGPAKTDLGPRVLDAGGWNE
jgi:hypothetical protein